jgi:thiamine pyrophosphokinase
MKRALILANGKPPGKRLLKRFLSSADLFICADGGANTAARYSCLPHLIIGDMDSIQEETLEVFADVKVKKLNDQNSTDLEKALTAALEQKCTEIVVLGATGGRLDHAIGNLSALGKFSCKASIKFVDGSGEYFPAGRLLKLHNHAGTTISLLPLSRCSGITTTGLQWNLKNESLEFGVRESTSNCVISSPVSIKVRTGSLIVFLLRSSKLHDTKLLSRN